MFNNQLSLYSPCTPSELLSKTLSGICTYCIVHMRPTPHHSLRAFCKLVQYNSTSCDVLTPPFVRLLVTGKCMKTFSRHVSRCDLILFGSYWTCPGSNPAHKSRAMAMARIPQSEPLDCLCTSTIWLSSLMRSRRCRKHCFGS